MQEFECGPILDFMTFIRPWTEFPPDHPSFEKVNTWL
jgi:hypothetical protein